mgnify:CR=1 FL=1
MQGLTVNTFRTSAVAVLGFLFLYTAQAESYDGVQSSASALDRTTLQAQGIAAATAPNQNVPRGSRGAERFTPMADPDRVATEAKRAASAPDQKVAAGSRVNSKVISTMRHPMDERAAAR